MVSYPEACSRAVVEVAQLGFAENVDTRALGKRWKEALS